jgi:peptide deformylase
MSHRLVYFGNETLKRVAEPVQDINGQIKELSDDMFNVMYTSRGIGLAAPQVDEALRLLVIDIEEYDGMKPVVLVNPEITEVSEETEPYEEGCLSLPGIMEDIVRPSEIHVRAVTVDGNEVEFDAGGLYARVLQHEIDHLNGIVFVDHLEDYVRKELNPQLKKIKRMNRE